MKKFICLLLSCVFLFGAFSTVSYAATNDTNAVMPRLNNTAIVDTGFVIDENGVATIKVSFVGYEGITTGATIKVKLQKRFLLVFWNDVDLGSNGNVLQYEIVGDNCFELYTLSLSKGTYRIQVEYEIRGSGGSADVLTEEIERTYKG